MITGVHTIFYTSRAEEMRAFIRDKLGFPGVDVGGGWLIFDLPPAEMGCHPDDPAHGQISGMPRRSAPRFSGGIAPAGGPAPPARCRWSGP